MNRKVINLSRENSVKDTLRLANKNELNQEIIQLLESDSNMPISKIALKLNTSESTICYCVKRMKESGILTIIKNVGLTGAKYPKPFVIGLISNTNSVKIQI